MADVKEALNKIYNMDCIEGMERLHKKYGSFVDNIITDPPFNISVDNNFHTMKGRAGIDFGEWDKGFDLTAWIDSADKLLKKDGNLVIFNSWQNMGIFTQYLEFKGYLVKQMITWKKSNPMPRNRDRLYVNSCEYAIWATKGKGWTFNRQRDTYENAIFEYPVVHSKNRIHVTEKPIELIKDLVKIHSNEGDILLEPFSGSGSLAKACQETNRNFIAFELDKEYYQKSCERIGQGSGK